jgi:hypothetical protein
MDDFDLQRWGLSESYSFGVEDCSYWGEIWLGKWLHNPRRNLRVPTLTEADKDALAEWLDAYPSMGMYIAQGSSLVSINPGAETDIQEKDSPDPDKNDFTPRGKFWYINDRNAAVRYDKQIDSDQAWNHNCGNIPVTLSAQSLDDLPAAPAWQCQDSRARFGVEGTNRGRIVISGNNVLSVFDSEFGRMDYSASNACKLR